MGQYLSKRNLRFSIILICFSLLTASSISPVSALPRQIQPKGTNQGPPASSYDAVWCSYTGHSCILSNLAAVTNVAVSQNLISSNQALAIKLAAQNYLRNVSTTPPFPGVELGLMYNINGVSFGSSGRGGGGAGGSGSLLDLLSEPVEHDPWYEPDPSYFTFTSYATLYENDWGNAHVKLEFGSMSEWYDEYDHNSDTLARSGHGFSLTFSL